MTAAGTRGGSPVAASLVGSIAAGIAAAAAREAIAGDGARDAAIAGAVALVLAAAASLVGRALWRSWQPAVDRASAARVAGALAFAAGAALLVAAAAGLGAAAARSMTHVPVLAGLTVGLSSIGAALVVAMVSAPAARGLARLFARLDRPDAAASPRGVLAMAAAIAAGLGALGWIAVLVAAARSGSTGPAPAVTGAVAALLAVHAASARRRG